jgi:hypothetical protein
MRRLAGILAIAAIAGAARADVYTYDFGTGASNYTTASGVSTVFLPQPAAGGGNDRVRVGTAGGGFYMENPGDGAVGSGSELKITAPTTTSANKFSIYDYTAAKSFSVAMTLKMTGGSAGSIYLFAGDGAQYSDNNTFSGAQTFTGLQWVYGASDTVTTSYRNAGSWTALSGTPFAQNSVYDIEIYGNNTTAAIDYTKGGAQSLAANTWDLWINGSLIGDGLNKAQLANDVNIDSFMIYGVSSAGNVASIVVDDISYANEITVIPEPASAGLLTLAGLGFAFRRLRRHKLSQASQIAP